LSIQRQVTPYEAKRRSVLVRDDIMAGLWAAPFPRIRLMTEGGRDVMHRIGSREDGGEGAAKHGDLEGAAPFSERWLTEDGFLPTSALLLKAAKMQPCSKASLAARPEPIVIRPATK
jgi:hypothetical protein